jgi:hypothetical protein
MLLLALGRVVDFGGSKRTAHTSSCSHQHPLAWERRLPARGTGLKGMKVAVLALSWSHQSPLELEWVELAKAFVIGKIVALTLGWSD